MIIFDIDETLSPTRPVPDWSEPHEVHRAFGFQVAIPAFLLTYLRTRDDIALLSTWEEGAAQLAGAFDFQARVLLPTAAGGIQGKFQRVLATPDVVAWADDHMTPTMRRTLAARGVIAVRPTGGHVSRRQLARLPH